MKYLGRRVGSYKTDQQINRKTHLFSHMYIYAWVVSTENVPYDNQW